jgi:PAS domain-containing protein
MKPIIDFQIVFHGLPHCYVLLTRDFVIVAATEAYYKTTRTTPERILHKYLFDVFPETPETIPESAGKNLSFSLRQVLHTKEQQAMQLQRYDLELTPGKRSAHWWRMVNAPILGPDGKVLYIVNMVEDVTGMVDRLESAQDALGQNR